MKTDSILYWVIYFIVTIIVAWVVLSLILLWFKPALYNSDGSVNWWTTLWVAILIIIFAWILMIILWLIIGLFRQGTNSCYKEPECPKPNPCDPCDKRYVGANGANVPNVAAGYDPRIWLY